jgi:ferredoxin
LKGNLTFLVEVDADKCIGCLACTSCHNFVCGKDFKARAVRPRVDEIGCNQTAAAICPVGAILISAPNPNPDKPEPNKIK